MNFIGTNKHDDLIGSAGADVIDGKRGGDWIDGGAGDDVLTGGAGDDIFVLRAGQGNDTVTDFDAGDRILFDFSSYSDLMAPSGALFDGETWTDFTGGTTFTVTDTGADTVITANGQSITLVGVEPGDVQGWQLYGG